MPADRRTDRRKGTRSVPAGRWSVWHLLRKWLARTTGGAPRRMTAAPPPMTSSARAPPSIASDRTRCILAENLLPKRRPPPIGLCLLISITTTRQHRPKSTSLLPVVEITYFTFYSTVQVYEKFGHVGGAQEIREKTKVERANPIWTRQNARTDSQNQDTSSSSSSSSSASFGQIFGTHCTSQQSPKNAINLHTPPIRLTGCQRNCNTEREPPPQTVRPVTRPGGPERTKPQSSDIRSYSLGPDRHAHTVAVY
jgi:hypothetical protein